jgi:threonine synthase
MDDGDADSSSHSEEKTFSGLVKSSESLSLLDTATPQNPVITPESYPLSKIASDHTRSLAERLESYEIILDSEVGDTSLTRARNIEREIGLRQIYLKFEGGNPTGTQKDRIAFAQALDALRRGYDEITVASCGNYGAAVALAASLAGLRCIIYIPGGITPIELRKLLVLGRRSEECLETMKKR